MKTSKPEKLTDYSWLNLYKVRWNNEGKKGEWIYASRKENKDNIDAVVIVPIHVLRNPFTNKEWKRLVVIKEFRIPINDYEYTFPAGLKDEKESVMDCAHRELREETGLSLTRVLKVSPPIYSATGLSDESAVMVFCECTGEISGENREATEEISVNLLDLEQINKLCNNYQVKQSGKLWPVLFMFQSLNSLEF
jgi:ADP-ribose pyrophosphatase